MKTKKDERYSDKDCTRTEREKDTVPEALQRALGFGPFLVNCAGVLLAVCIALGGVLLVHRQLEAEESRLLGEGGAVELAVQVEGAQADGEEIKPDVLTEEELLQVVNCLNNETEVGLHEPLAGQLSMTEAVQQGREWLSDFLLPRLGLESAIPQEYKSNCYLWGRMEDKEDSVQEELFSYWMISLDGDDMYVNLTLNAVTGQVLSANVRCRFPAEFRIEEKQYELVEDYLASFGVEASFTVRGHGGEWLDGRSMGNDEIMATVEIGVSSVIATPGQGDEIVSTDYLLLHLYLEMVE